MRRLGWYNIYIFFYCVGVQRQINPCGSFCVGSQRKGEKEIEEIVEEMKERDWVERETGMKGDRKN